MGLKQLYNDNLRTLPNEYGDVSVMQSEICKVAFFHQNKFQFDHRTLFQILLKLYLKLIQAIISNLSFHSELLGQCHESDLGCNTQDSMMM